MEGPGVWSVHGLTAGGERIEDEPVFLRLASARTHRNNAGTEMGAEPVIQLRVFPWNTWQYVKWQMRAKWPGLKSVKDGSMRLLHKGVELKASSLVDDYHMEGGHLESDPVELQYFIIDKADGCEDIGLFQHSMVPCTAGLQKRFGIVLAAMLHGIAPRLTEDGTGATYLLRDSLKKRVHAVFKPKDEEAFAPQNPRGHVGAENCPGLRQGVYSTQQAVREVAAYLLDHGEFAGVPETTLVHSRHPSFVKVQGEIVWKIGAFQAFVETKDTACDMSCKVFSVSDVHRIGILDIRIVNLDRNDGNLLVRRRVSENGTPYAKLVPIDHGLSLPDCLEVYDDDLCWMSWPQAKKKFDEQSLEYIRKLNGSKDARLLHKRLGISRDALRLMEVTTKLLQIGAEHNLSLHSIGSVMCREDRDSPSVSKLEEIIENCLETALAAVGDEVLGCGSKTLSGLDLQSSTGVGTRPTSKRSEAPYTPVASAAPAPSVPECEPLPCAKEFTSSPPGSPFSARTEVTPPCADRALDSYYSLSDDGGPVRDSRTLLSIRSTEETHRDSQVSPSSSLAASGDTPTMRSRKMASYKGTTSALKMRATTLAASERKGARREVQERIFSRQDHQGNETVTWTPDLERVFRRHIEDALTTYIKKYSRRKAEEPESEASPSEADGAVGAQSLASAFSKMPLEMDRETASSLLEVAKSATSGTELPLTQKAKDEAPKKYVPPHMRRRTASAFDQEVPPTPPTVAPAGLPEDEKEDLLIPTHGSDGTERWGWSVHQGPKPFMEDAVDAERHFGDSNTEFYAVYDGHGGSLTVEYLKRSLPGAIRGHPNFADAAQIPNVLKSAFSSTEDALVEILQARPPPRTMQDADAGQYSMKLSSGCVCCVALVRERTVYVSNLGDCRGILCNDGKPVALTEDHSPEVNQKERERLEGIGVEVSSDGYLHGRIAVSRAFGDWCWERGEKCMGIICQPEFTQAEVTEETEFLLLACDGIFEKMDSNSAVRIVRRRLRATGDAKAAAEALVQDAFVRTGSDNLSAVVVLFKRPAAVGGEGRTAPRLFGRKLADLAEAS